MAQTTSRRLSDEDRSAMRRIAAPFETKSAKIRALNAAGYQRARIADFLGIRYQHVRNVLEHEARPGVLERVPEDRPSEAPTFGVCRVEADARIALPPAVLVALQAQPGDSLAWRFGDDELVLMGRHAGVSFAQGLAASKPSLGEASWTESLRAERRLEASKEEARESDG